MTQFTGTREKPVESVLPEDAQKSTNFFESDRILRDYLASHLRADALNYIGDKLYDMGRTAACELHELSIQADRNPPELIQRTPYGLDCQEIRFHPSYWEMMDIAARSEMLFVKWDPTLKERFPADRNKLGFAIGQLFAMSEEGFYCPLCMTDGAARVIDRFGDEPDKKRLIPALAARTGADLKTGAMFLTEKSGGSDVGANRTVAEHDEGPWYHLSGEKWFCSNANADVMLVLARTGDPGEGIHGLSLFLVEKYLTDGSQNPMYFIRLKDKLGVRSMATAEIRLDDTRGKLIGEEGRGFYYMTEMINMSRLYNSVAAVAGARRTLIEAYEFISYRKSFGKVAIEHALIRQNLWELGSVYLGVFLLVWRTIRALDGADTGDEREKNLCRLLIPISKWWSAEMSIYIGRESMELMGGIGYTEDLVMPRLYRDLLVLPIWEGSGNVIVLDMLRASQKSLGLGYLLEEVEQSVARVTGRIKDVLVTQLDTLKKRVSGLNDEDQDRREVFAKAFFKDLARLYIIGLLVDELSEENRLWIEPALDFFFCQLDENYRNALVLPDADRIRGLMGWIIK